MEVVNRDQSAPFFTTGSLLMLCSCIRRAASLVVASRSMVISGAGVMISMTFTLEGSSPWEKTF